MQLEEELQVKNQKRMCDDVKLFYSCKSTLQLQYFNHS